MRIKRQSIGRRSCRRLVSLTSLRNKDLCQSGYSDKSEQGRATIPHLKTSFLKNFHYFSCSDSGLVRSSFGIFTSTAV